MDSSVSAAVTWKSLTFRISPAPAENASEYFCSVTIIFLGPNSRGNYSFGNPPSESVRTYSVEEIPMVYFNARFQVCNLSAKSTLVARVANVCVYAIDEDIESEANHKYYP